MGKRKKIICTVINDLTYDQRMHRVCTTLANEGYDVLLLGRVKEKSVDLTEQVFAQKRIVCFSYTGFMMYFEFNLRVLIYLLFHRFDMVNAVDLDTIIPASLAARIKSKPMIYDAHELFTEVPEIVNRPYLYKIWSWIETNFVPTAWASYTVALMIAEIFTEKYDQSFSVIRNVPRRQSFQPTRKTEKIILYQGAINTGRGLKEIIAAMIHLDEEIKLWIIGDGDLYEEIKDASLATTAKQRIKMFGYIAPEELKEMTKKAWIGINLLENVGLSYYYSLANRTFDFIQAHVPAIHMDFPEYRAINDKYQVAELVPDLTTDSIVKAVNSLENEDRYDRLKQNCQIAAAELCWENEEDKLLGIYEQLQ